MSDAVEPKRKLTLDKRLNLIIGNLRSISKDLEFMKELGEDRMPNLYGIGHSLVALRDSLK